MKEKPKEEDPVIEKLKALIVRYEYSGGMYIPTQEIRKAMQWYDKDSPTPGSGS